MNCGIPTLTLSLFYRSCSMATISLFFTEVKRRWATLILGWVAVSVHYLCLLLLLLFIIIIMYLYSAQYLHILQDSKRYLTHPTVQVQPQLTSNSHSPNWKTEAQG